MTKRERIFLSPPHMAGQEQTLVAQAFASNYIAPLGPMVDAFEREFADYTGIPHCVALASGTAATHLALRQLGGSCEFGVVSSELGGQRPLVLASTLTFIASVTPAVMEGCEVVFVDSDRATWNMDVVLLEEALADYEQEGRLPIAVVPTDLYGQCCVLPRIVALCDRYGIPVVCDSAEAMGARYRGGGGEVSGFRFQVSGSKGADGGEAVSGSEGAHGAGGAVSWQEDPIHAHAGGLSDRQTLDPETRNLTPETYFHSGHHAWASVYSFNGNKIITTSGGGMLASHDGELIAHARKLSQQARDPAPWYEHSEIGFNYRMSNILAAIGRGQLRVLDDRVARRREIFRGYQERLAGLEGLSFMPEAANSRGNRWLTVIQLDPAAFGATPEQVRLALEEENIESRPVWKPMHMQPVFGGCRVWGGAVAEDLFRHGLCLPSGTTMSEDDIDRVCDGVRACVRPLAAGTDCVGGI